MELESVLHVWIHQDQDLVDLTITTTLTVRHGSALTTMRTREVIHTNQKHPFFTIEQGFLAVSQITLGMHILRADGRVGVVTGWKVVAGTKVMYNLEVAQDHTFTVGVGMWVVHNSGGDCGGTTQVDLYRSGNAGGPRLDNVRPGKEAITDANGNTVVPPGKGISTFASQGGGKNWWMLPSGSPIPSSLRLVNDHGEHWLFEPTSTMSQEEYISAVEQTLSYWSGHFHLYHKEKTMLEEKLDQATFADKITREQIIRELARQSDEIIDLLLNTLKEGPKKRWKTAVSVLGAIGYPRNAVALPHLITELSDRNSPAWEEVVAVLIDIGPSVVVPAFIQAMLNASHQPYWVDTIEGICTMLSLASVEQRFAVPCGPTVVYLLSQGMLGDDNELLEPEYLIDVLKKIGSECASYALPTLLTFLKKEGTSTLGKQAYQLITSFDKDVLEPYALVLAFVSST